MGKEIYSAIWTQEGNVEPRNIPIIVIFIIFIFLQNIKFDRL